MRYAGSSDRAVRFLALSKLVFSSYQSRKKKKSSNWWEFEFGDEMLSPNTCCEAAETSGCRLTVIGLTGSCGLFGIPAEIWCVTNQTYTKTEKTL